MDMFKEDSEFELSESFKAACREMMWRGTKVKIEGFVEKIVDMLISSRMQRNQEIDFSKCYHIIEGDDLVTSIPECTWVDRNPHDDFMGYNHVFKSSRFFRDDMINKLRIIKPRGRDWIDTNFLINRIDNKGTKILIVPSRSWSN